MILYNTILHSTTLHDTTYVGLFSLRVGHKCEMRSTRHYLIMTLMLHAEGRSTLHTRTRKILLLKKLDTIRVIKKPLLSRHSTWLDICHLWRSPNNRHFIIPPRALFPPWLSPTRTVYLCRWLGNMEKVLKAAGENYFAGGKVCQEDLPLRLDRLSVWSHEQCCFSFQHIVFATVLYGGRHSHLWSSEQGE